MPRRTVLVVEDEAPLRKALKIQLERTGFEVVEAANGEEGITKASEYRPDAVLLDLLMPVKSGKIMLKELREKDWGKDIDVVILTQIDTGQENLTENYQVDYMVKSNSKLEEVVERIKFRLSQHDEPKA